MIIKQKIIFFKFFLISKEKETKMDQVFDIKNKEPQSIDTLQLSNEETYKLSYKAKDASMFEIRDRRTSK